MIDYNFAFFLTGATFLSGIIVLIDTLFLAKKRKAGVEEPLVIEYARSFFPVLLLVWVIRSFVVQPYRVPTGSLEPTILPGDFIVVTQFSYGIRLPVLNTKIISVSEPKRGDIALFRWPVNPRVVFVKRVVGLPGDHVVYNHKTLYINGVKMEQKMLGKSFDIEPGQNIPAYLKMENLDGVQHPILLQIQGGENIDCDLMVPEGHYFMVGDNRDDSDDSRSWGFVPEQNLVGKAQFVWMSWDSENHSIRWERIGNRVH